MLLTSYITISSPPLLAVNAGWRMLRILSISSQRAFFLFRPASSSSATNRSGIQEYLGSMLDKKCLKLEPAPVKKYSYLQSQSIFYRSQNQHFTAAFGPSMTNLPLVIQDILSCFYQISLQMKYILFVGVWGKTLPVLTTLNAPNNSKYNQDMPDWQEPVLHSSPGKGGSVIHRI